MRIIHTAAAAIATLCFTTLADTAIGMNAADGDVAACT